MVSRVVLGLGSNSGNRLSYISRAVREICLSGCFDYLAVSRIYETEPWGFKNQNKFLNCVLAVLCRLEPEELIDSLKALEKRLGRSGRGVWMEREIDIDVLFYGERIIHYGRTGVIIPHPRMHLRNFVLIPLCELLPDLVHPKLGKKLKYLLKSSPDKSAAGLYRKKPELF